MTALLIIIHVIVCIALIMIVLLQTGKGADMGAAFGGGSSQTLFGSTGASTFLSKATTGAAIVFMLTSLVLAYISSHPAGSSVMNRIEVEAPQEESAPMPTETTTESSAVGETETETEAPAPAAQPESGAEAGSPAGETAPADESAE
ncbi:MAG: preprotein translocase subunit SecG [Thermodesulfobacteriota bacterium]